MFKDLAATIADGTDLRPSLEAMAAAWAELPLGEKKRAGAVHDFAYAAWASPDSRHFPWHRHAGVLEQIGHPLTAQLVYKSGADASPRTWELIGYAPALRHRLVINLASIESIPLEERPTDIRVLHREIITAFRIEEMALERQTRQLRSFLESSGCRILHLRGVDDAAAALRRQPFQAYAVENPRTRLKSIIAQLFAVSPRILAHPSTDPIAVLGATGADQLISFDPNRRPAFDLEPVLKAECDLYLNSGVIEQDVADLGLTITALTEVLQERFCSHATVESVSA